MTRWRLTLYSSSWLVRAHWYYLHKTLHFSMHVGLPFAGQWGGTVMCYLAQCSVYIFFLNFIDNVETYTPLKSWHSSTMPPDVETCSMPIFFHTAFHHSIVMWPRRIDFFFSICSSSDWHSVKKNGGHHLQQYFPPDIAGRLFPVTGWFLAGFYGGTVDPSQV